MTFRAAAIHTGPIHYLDHLGILCVELKLPLIVTEKETYDAACKFYPELQCQYLDLSDLSLDYLAEHYDVLFESGHRWAAELLPLFELLFRKKMRIVYCPHGNSDKGHSELHPIPKDVSLYYGDHMRDLLARTGSLERLNSIVRTGNYRYAYYRKQRSFYDKLLEPYLHLDPYKKTIFYAPSWPDGENPSSFLDCAERVIEEIGEYFNILVRWHPFLHEIYPAQTERLQGIYEGKRGIVFLNDFPCIYPILQASDAYLGDYSSIGYDFLSFDRPLFFFEAFAGPLSHCGVHLSSQANLGQALLKHQDSPHHKKARQNTYAYAFGRERKGEEVLRELKEALSKERTSWIHA